MTDTQIIEEATRLVDEGISVTLPVNGKSMLPFIVGGRDSVILRKTVAPHVGDVVLAWVEGCRYVLHRIINVDDDRITLMGDGNLAAVEHCAPVDIRAIATHVVRENGRSYDLYSRKLLLASRLWHRMRPFRRYLLSNIFFRKFLSFICFLKKND